MADTSRTTAYPRWGQHARESKAEAIFFTLQRARGESLAQGTWLDIGCGSGGIVAALAQRVENVIGVDPESWDRWRDFAETHANLNFHVGSYRDLDSIVGCGTVDVVICNQVYEHVDDPAALLAAIHDVLRPDGVCYFAGPNLLWPIEPHVFWPFVHWLPRAFAQGAMRVLGSRRAQNLDAFAWTYWRLKHAFLDAGFEARSAIHDRLAAAAVLRPKLLTRLTAAIPQTLVAALTPAAPGFIFLLRKLP